VDYFFEFLAVAGEEDCPCSRTEADAYDVAFLVEREGRLDEGLWGRIEGLVESSLAQGSICYRMLVPAYCQLKSLRKVPGSRKEGYGFVARPTETTDVSGLSCIFASQ